MYKASQAAPGAAGAAPDATANGRAPEGEKKKDEGVIDAEYVDVDDKK
jgi:molecular chaperone DnaK